MASLVTMVTISLVLATALESMAYTGTSGFLRFMLSHNLKPIRSSAAEVSSQTCQNHAPDVNIFSPGFVACPESVWRMCWPANETEEDGAPLCSCLKEIVPCANDVNRTSPGPNVTVTFDLTQDPRALDLVWANLVTSPDAFVCVVDPVTYQCEYGTSSPRPSEWLKKYLLRNKKITIATKVIPPQCDLPRLRIKATSHAGCW